MTTFTDLELDRILDQFLGEGPASAPDRAIDAALDRIADLGQRRTPVVTRRLNMSTPVRLLLAAALVLALAAAGAAFLGSRPPGPDVVPPVESQAPSATATASAATTAPPSATPLAAVTPRPVSPAVSVMLAAVNRADQAVTATKGPLGITDADQSRLLQLIDNVHTALDGVTTDPSVASDAVDAFATDAIARTEPLGEQYRVRLRTAVAALQGAVAAKPFVPEGLDAGTWYSSRFPPPVALTLPAGWSRGLEDSEVLALQKGKMTLAVNKMATEATAAGAAKAIGASLTLGPTPVTFPSYVGFTAGADGGGTLWFTEGLQAFDAPKGDVVRVWVLQAGAKPITVTLSGPPAEVKAALPEVEKMLGTMVVGQQ